MSYNQGLLHDSLRASDNGPEFIAEMLKTYLVEACYDEPEALWQNGHVGSLNTVSPNEMLGQEQFSTILEAGVLSEPYRRRAKISPGTKNGGTL